MVSKTSTSPRVIVIGAGFGGITMAVKLKKAGFDNFTVLEAGGGPGGAWWHNHYPGAETDVNGIIYSLPYRDHVWTRTHAKQPELAQYIDETLDMFHVRDRFRFNEKVQEVRWDDATRTHTVTTASGEKLECDVVVSAVGLFSDPKEPSWPGVEKFTGRVFHTQMWPDDVDLTGKRVAVVGTGASSVQVIPTIAPDVKQLYVFQREPGWVLPKGDRDYTEEDLKALGTPLKRKWNRLKVMAKNEVAYLWKPVYLVGSEKNEKYKALALDYLEKTFADRPDLKEALTPHYAFSGKRRILTDSYFPALKRENVELVPHSVSALTETGIVDSEGVEREVDIVVAAIGFKASTYLSSLQVYGRNGRDLQEEWRDGAYALLGTAVPNFPNFYMLYGPNTNGAAPITWLQMQQAAYVVANLKRMKNKGVTEIDVKKSWTSVYNKVLQRRLAKTAWAQGNNYFRGPKGQVVTQWRDGLVVYSLLLKILRRPASTSR
jgi:cation diffusion facilitator CzcD-associated flavoprotein CzcO